MDTMTGSNDRITAGRRVSLYECLETFTTGSRLDCRCILTESNIAQLGEYIDEVECLSCSTLVTTSKLHEEIAVKSSSVECKCERISTVLFPYLLLCRSDLGNEDDFTTKSHVLTYLESCYSKGLRDQYLVDDLDDKDLVVNVDVHSPLQSPLQCNKPSSMIRSRSPQVGDWNANAKPCTDECTTDVSRQVKSDTAVNASSGSVDSVNSINVTADSFDDVAVLDDIDSLTVQCPPLVSHQIQKSAVSFPSAGQFSESAVSDMLMKYSTHKLSDATDSESDSNSLAKRELNALASPLSSTNSMTSSPPSSPGELYLCHGVNASDPELEINSDSNAVKTSIDCAVEWDSRCHDRIPDSSDARVTQESHSLNHTVEVCEPTAHQADSKIDTVLVNPGLVEQFEIQPSKYLIKVRSKIIKTCKFSRYPKILCLHLNRRVYHEVRPRDDVTGTHLMICDGCVGDGTHDESPATRVISNCFALQSAG